jgi:hypothetical protein
MTDTDKIFCSLCGRELDHNKIVWFEVNCVTNEIWEVDVGFPPTWNDTEYSQGCFPYGLKCANKVRKTGKAIFGENN